MLRRLCFPAQQPRIPFAFDAGLAAQPASTQQKITQLNGKLPAGFQLPADFEELASAPDGGISRSVT